MNFAGIYEAVISALTSTTLTEWLIFTTAIIYVVLAAFENVWCWLFGIISSASSVYLCYTGHLFLESGLSVFYVIIGIYGWYQWLHGSKENSEITIVHSNFKQNIFLLLIGVIIWIPFGYAAHNFSTQAMPYLDAFITSFSIVATWMTAKKIIENWWYWIVVDALAVVLYTYRGFYLIGLLYIIYTILAAAGYFSWLKKIRK
jgi:nicotinamide mononucleotide transporter